jgi:hypothetical protein
MRKHGNQGAGEHRQAVRQTIPIRQHFPSITVLADAMRAGIFLPGWSRFTGACYPSGTTQHPLRRANGQARK